MRPYQLLALQNIKNYKEAFMKLCLILLDKHYLSQSELENICSNYIPAEDIFNKLK